MNQPLVTVEGLRVSYRGRQVSSMPRLDLLPGQLVAIVGESGSGKSTLLLAMLGLLPQSARVEGSIRIGSVDMVTAGEHARRAVRGSEIALVMQSPQASLNPTMRLGGFARRALRHHGVSRSAADSRIAAALTGVRLDQELLHRYPHEISGGQAQRFAIALALALGARTILADEPTSALDVTVQADVVQVLQQVRSEQQTSVVLVSHDLALVSTIADQIWIMKDGEVVDSGDPDYVLNHSEVPYTRALVAAVPVLSEPAGTGADDE